MPLPSAQDRQRRIIQLSGQWGIVLPPAPARLTRPEHPPSFIASGDDQSAEDLLQRRAAEVAQIRPKSGLSRAFSSSNLKKGKHWDPKDIIEVLNSWVGSCGSAGVAEALIAKLGAAGIDLNGMPTQKSGLLNRRRSLETFVDRTRLLRLAVERGQLDMVQVLVPHADPLALDTCLPVAIRSGNTPIVELLLRYGANTSQTAEGQDAFRQACVVHGLADMISLILQSDGRPSPECVSLSMNDAARADCLAIVLHLSRSTADGNFNGAQALKTAVNSGRRDIAIAIAMGNKPPQSPGLEEAFQLLTENPSINSTTKLEIAELLLCCGAQGDVLSQALELACASQFYDMANLLASYGVSIEYNDASVLKSAISRGQLDLVRSLLNDDSKLGPALASSCVALIPRQAPLETRHELLSLLLKKGAGGTALDECLIQAAQAGDIHSAELLLTPRFPERSPSHMNGRDRRRPRVSNRHEMASPDHKSGEALRTAVLRADVVMTAKILAAKPSAETLTSVFPLTKNLSTMDRYQMVDLFLKGALSGPTLHAALQDAINEDMSRRDDALIRLLLKNNADVNYNNGAGLQAVIMQRDLNLLALLVQNASPQTAAARIPDVMQVNDHHVRYDMMGMLLRIGAVIGVNEVAAALQETLSEKPVDMSLLRLILEQGSADINALEGTIVKRAVRNPDPKVLDLVLSFGKPSVETINRALGELTPMASTDSKTWKLNVILSRSGTKPDVNNMLVHEVQTLARDSAKRSSTSTLKQLLDSGADPNSFQAAALCVAVAAADAQLSDLLFECRIPPTPASLASTLPHALRISDPMDRLTFTKRLIDAGAFPMEVNRALIHAIGAYPDDVALINLLASSADASDGDALALSITKASPQTLELVLVKTKHTIQQRDAALVNAMNIKEWTPRLAICRQLAKAGISSRVASDALLIASRDGDLQLGDVLITHGASISTNDGQAIIEACRGGSVEVLDVLLRSNLDAQKTTLERGFQAATEVGDLNKRAELFQRLLKKGVKGEVVDAQLVSAAKYGEGGQEVLRVLLGAGADPNYSNGEAVFAATRSAFVVNLELLLGLWHEGGNQKKASAPTLLRSLKACWKLSHDIRFQIIQDLIKAGMPATEEVHIALSKAINEDVPDERLIKLLLDCGASPLTNGCKTLVDATQKVAASSLKLLLSGDIPEGDINRVFSLGFAADNFQVWFTPEGLEVARMLLEKGAKGDSLSGALILAMRNSADGSAELADHFVDVLVDHGADVNFNNGETLKEAASKANVNWTRKLLSCNPSAETLSLGFNHIFDTALSPDEAIKLFAMFTEYQGGEARMDVMAVNHGSQPVLVRAISQYPRSTEVLQTLLDAGFYHDQATFYRVHPTIEDEEEVTLLAWAIAQPQKRVSTSLIEMLIQRGANVNFETAVSRSTPLMLAIEARRPDVVKALLIEGAEVDVADSLGRSPLSMATNIGGDLSIQIMGNLLALEPSKDDGSLHNAARELNLAAVRVLVQAGHDPDFPSPLHGGRSALGEVCLHGSDMGELTADREKSMQKVIAFLVEAGSDLTLKSDGKSLLHLCFSAFDSLATTRSFLKVAMWKHVNKPFNQYNDGEHTYSPTMYVTKILPRSDRHDQLLTLLRANRALDVYYANSGEQPDDAVGLPEDLEVQERERKARLQRIAKEAEDHSILLARKKEVATVEQQIWAHKAELEDARRRRLHHDDLSGVRAKAQLEESLLNAALNRRLSEQRVLTDASLQRTKAIAAAEVNAEDQRQQKMLEWEGRMNTEKVDNARALTALRISEREEIERIDRSADARVKQRLETQKKLVDSQEKLAKRLASGPTDTRRQIGYVEELN
ncbi:Fc.00g080750.m01.CDS01 [Cosmosporella sp. VM-42]